MLRRRDGTAAVELALVAPMLLILAAGIIDFARAYRDEIELSSVVAAASQYALLHASSITSGNAASLAATLTGIVANGNGAAWASASVTVNDGASNAISSGTTTTGGTAANANSCWCPTGTAGNPTWGVAATCGGACAGGGVAGKFVTIAGTRAFSALFTSYGLVPNTTLTQSTMVQAQ